MASKRGEEEEEDLTEEMKNLRELQRQELSKVRGREGRWAPSFGQALTTKRCLILVAFGLKCREYIGNSTVSNPFRFPTHNTLIISLEDWYCQFVLSNH